MEKRRYLYHYTTIEALMSMLHLPTDAEKDAIIANNESGEGYYLTFHATDARMMNDKMEHQMVLEIIDKMIPLSLRNKYNAETIAVGNPYVVSFCSERDYLPMWEIYAQNKHGVCLKFDLSEENINTLNSLNRTNVLSGGDIEFCPCEYKTRRELKKYVQEYLSNVEEEYKSLPPNKISKDYPLKALYQYGVRCKNQEWEYEKEYRLILWHNFCETKAGRFGVCAYRPVNIPLRFLKEIMIAPCNNQDLVLYGVQSWVESKGLNLLSKYGIDIKISKSNSSLRTQ